MPDDGVDPRVLEVIALLLDLPQDLRLEVFAEFCRHCGTEHTPCPCWNDE